MSEQDGRIAEAIEREQGRLRNFIRRRVPDREDVEDVLQDVFYELVEAYRLTKPIEEVGAWLFRVARNRIIDRFRRKRPEVPATAFTVPEDDEGEAFGLEELLPSPDAGPEAAYARGILHSLRRAARPRLGPRRLAGRHEASLGADDSRGARAVVQGPRPPVGEDGGPRAGAEAVTLRETGIGRSDLESLSGKPFVEFRRKSS